ncbi:hypothetical protein TKK_0001892 [Trichogramma kaykai]
MALLDVKFTKFDNRPWGFRLAGGSDFPEPLTVIRVAEGSLAECMGLKVGDIVVKLNDRDISDLTHGQAHEALTLAGNNYVLSVKRREDPSAALEGIEEKIEPYMRPIEQILFDSIEETTEIIEETSETIEAEPEKEPVEEYPEKPRDQNSDPVPNKNLTDEEIAQLILDEEEVLRVKEKGVLGVDFKKLRPRAPLLKESKVFAELQQEANTDPVEIQKQNTLSSTFLQRPDRPVPKPRLNSVSESEAEVEPYRVVIKKQPKKSVTEKLLKKGLIDSSRLSQTPEPTPPAESIEDPTIYPATPQPVQESPLVPKMYDQLKPEIRNDFVPVRAGKVRYLRRGKYAKRFIDQAFESFRIPTGKTKPTLLKRAHYFERIVGDVKKSLNGEKDDSNFLRVILLTSLAYSLRDTYDAEILHRGSSRRNSRRMSSCSRRQSMVENLCPYENGVYVFRGRKNSESLQSLQSTCAEGRRRLSVMGMLVADKINYAMRTDLARGLAYAMVPCASALAFFMFNYAKRFNNDNQQAA